MVYKLGFNDMMGGDSVLCWEYSERVEAITPKIILLTGQNYSITLHKNVGKEIEVLGIN